MSISILEHIDRLWLKPQRERELAREHVQSLGQAGRRGLHDGYPPTPDNTESKPPGQSWKRAIKIDFAWQQTHGGSFQAGGVAPSGNISTARKIDGVMVSYWCHGKLPLASYIGRCV